MTVKELVAQIKNIPKIAVSDPDHAADEIVPGILRSRVLYFDDKVPVMKQPPHQRIKSADAEAMIFNHLDEKAQITVPSKQIKESIKRLCYAPKLQIDLTEEFWRGQMYVNLTQGIYDILKQELVPMRNEIKFDYFIGIRYMDDAILDRLVYVMFDKEIPEEEIDLDLEEKLLKEKDVIFSIALDSLKGLIEDKYDFKMGSAAEEHIKHRRYLIHSTESFLEERCKLTEYGKVSKVTLYAAYVAFCKANALKPDGRNSFYDKVRNFDSAIMDGRAPDSSGNSVQGFHGISLIGGERKVTDDEADD